MTSWTLMAGPPHTRILPAALRHYTLNPERRRRQANTAPRSRWCPTESRADDDLEARMSWDPAAFLEELSRTVGEFDRPGATTLCDHFVRYLRATDDLYALPDAKKV